MKWIGQQIYDEVVRFRNDVYFEADNITFQSANADDPIVTIKNTSNAANDMASLKFVKDRGAAPAIGDNLAEIYFVGEDSDQNTQEYGRILCETDVVTGGQESGVLKFGVANHDGDNGYGFVLTGGSVNSEVDATVGLGVASVTTLAGTLTMGSTATINNSGVIQVAAQTVIDHDQLANYAANEHFTQANITTVGTIGTGVWQGTAIASAYLDSDTAHLSGTQTFTGNKSFSGTTNFTSDANGRPSVNIENTGNNTEGGIFKFLQDKGAAGADNDIPGRIHWQGDNDAQEQYPFAEIYGTVADATDGQEAGAMYLKVAAYDGVLETGLKLDGDTDADGEVDVTIGSGTASVTTIAGDLTITGDQLTFNSSKGRRTCFELTGYSVADGSNYFYSNIMSGNKAPFLHDVNIGSDGLTADNPAAFLRANGTVMPYAGTLKIWKGWGASNGSGDIDVTIFKYTPTANDATNASLVVVKNTQFTAAGNDNLKTWSETSFSVAVAAGDILITGIKGSTSAKTAYFVSTVEIEWS